MKLFSICDANSFALAIAPFIPSLPGVKTNSAPYAFIRFLLSTDIVSGIVITIFRFNAVATADSPIPVFPLVGSINVVFSLINPFSSASRIISLAILSLTDPAGLKYSSFARTSAFNSSFLIKLFTLTSGVFPTRSKKLFFTLLIFPFLLIPIVLL